MFRVATNRFLRRQNVGSPAPAIRPRPSPNSIISQGHDADRVLVTAEAPRHEAESPSVWMSALLPENELRSYFHLLSFDEIARSRTLRQSGDRERFLTGRVLLRLALSHTVGNRLHPSAWRFSPGRFGKPEMSPGLPVIHFNLSHAAGVVAIAIDPAMPIGVDVEPLDGLAAVDLPSSVLSDRERAALDRCDERARVREFVRLWTLKEAHAKRVGLGVHLDFASFDIDWQPGLDDQVIEGDGEVCETRSTRIDAAVYQVSTALGAGRRPVRWREISIAKLARPLL